MTINPKRWQCIECKKQYVYLSKAARHNRVKHEGKSEFRDLQELKLI